MIFPWCFERNLFYDLKINRGMFIHVPGQSAAPYSCSTGQPTAYLSVLTAHRRRVDLQRPKARGSPPSAIRLHRRPVGLRLSWIPPGTAANGTTRAPTMKGRHELWFSSAPRRRWSDSRLKRHYMGKWPLIIQLFYYFLFYSFFSSPEMEEVLRYSDSLPVDIHAMNVLSCSLLPGIPGLYCLITRVDRIWGFEFWIFHYFEL